MTARARGPRVGFGPLHRFAWYNRLQAWVLRRGFGPYDRFMAPFKQRLLGSLRGRVLECGAGTGRELEFLGSDVRQFVAVEPNSFNLAGLRAEAARLGRAVQPVVAAAEALPFADAVFDGAISSLVLCTVHDPAAAVAELRRTLRPGGRFVFLEHVAAPRGSWLRRVQRLVRPTWAALADGCHPDRETGRTIEGAGFESVEIEEVRVPAGLVGPHIVGEARK